MDVTVYDAVIEYMDRTWDLALRLTFEFDVLCSHSDFLGYGFGDLSCGSLVGFSDRFCSYYNIHHFETLECFLKHNFWSLPLNRSSLYHC